MQTHGGLINLPNHLPSWLFPECVQGIIFPLELSLPLSLSLFSRSSFSTSREHSPFCSGYIFSSPLLAQLAVQGRNLLETSFLSTSSPLRLPFNLFLRPVPAPSFSKFKAFLDFLNVLSRHFFLVYQRVYFFVQSFIPFLLVFSIRFTSCFISLEIPNLADSLAVFSSPFRPFRQRVAPTVKLSRFPFILRFKNFTPIFIEFSLFFYFSFFLSFFNFWHQLYFPSNIFSRILLLLFIRHKFFLFFVSYFF